MCLQEHCLPGKRAQPVLFTVVIAAGKGTKFLPAYHSSTPDTVWDHYGLTAAQAADAGMNSQMFNSFLDGTKSALEMAAIANATGLDAPENGLQFPPAGMDDLAHVLRPKNEGGQLSGKGQVEVVSVQTVSFNRAGIEYVHIFSGTGGKGDWLYPAFSRRRCCYRKA